MKNKAAEVSEKQTDTPPVTEVDAAEMPMVPTTEQQPDSVQTSEPSTKKRFAISRRGLAIALVVALNLAMGGMSAYLWLHKPKALSSQPVATVPVQNGQTETKAPEPETSKTLHYKSEQLAAEFDYPVDWRVQESGSEYAQGVQLSSPQFAIKGASGNTDQAKVVLLIYKQYNSYATYEDSVATQAPEQISYSNPAPGQVPRTYASFFGNPIYKDGKPTNGIPSSFYAIVIGGSFNYQTGQHLKDKNYLKASPFVEMHVQITTYHQNLALVELNNDIWKNDETLQQAKAVVASMRFN